MVIFLFSATMLNSESITIEKCVSINNDKNRLDCFDSFFVESEQEQQEQEVQEIVQKKPQIEKEPAIRKRFIKRKEKIEYKIPKVVSNLMIEKIVKRNGSYILTLNNDTKWTTSEVVWNDNELQEKASIEIVPGVFGSKFIKIKGTKIKLRVKEIK